MKQSKRSKRLTAALSTGLALTCAAFLIGFPSKAAGLDERSSSTYTGHATVENFNYGLNVTVTMNGSTIKSITAEQAENYNSSNDYFWDMAVNGTADQRSPLKQIVDTQSTKNIDVVTQATYTSKALIKAVEVALASIPEPTAAPVNPTAAPVNPTAAPVNPTAAPVEPTIDPTTAPVPPTGAISIAMLGAATAFCGAAAVFARKKES